METETHQGPLKHGFSSLTCWGYTVKLTILNTLQPARVGLHSKANYSGNPVSESRCLYNLRKLFPPGAASTLVQDLPISKLLLIGQRKIGTNTLVPWKDLS